jgi:Rad3-related DNA helicase
LIAHPEQERWVYECNDSNEFKITPINVDFVFKKYIEPLSKKFIFMSATIGDPSVFIKSLGLPENDCKYYECDSPFEARKSPIIVLERLDLSYRNIDNELNKCLQYIEALAKKHEKTNGIIHTGNYKIARYIYENASKELQNRLVFKEKYDNVNNTKLINIHETNVQNNISSVLLSPSLVEGVDLKDDLSRWQIIIKLPFSSLGDKRIKHLADKFPNWYTNDVVKKIIQACGRSTRHAEDSSVTYILDKVTQYTFSKVKIPLWFKNRLIFK